MNSNLSFLFTLPLVCTVCGLPPNIGTVSLCLCGPCFGCVLVDFVRKERAHLGFGTFTLNLNNANALDDHKWFNFVVFWTESPLPELSTITTTISPTSFAQEQFLLPNQRQFGFDHWNLSILSTFLIQSSFLPESGSKCFFFNCLFSLNNLNHNNNRAQWASPDDDDDSLPFLARFYTHRQTGLLVRLVSALTHTPTV